MLVFKSNISAHVLTKSWFQIFNYLQVNTLQRGQFTANNGRIQILYPTGIFAKARFQILIEIPSPLLLVGMGLFLKSFINPTSFKKGSKKRNLPKDGEFKTQPVEKI